MILNLYLKLKNVNEFLDGSGYVEDGREIFDDDLNEEAPSANNKNSKSYEWNVNDWKQT